MSKMSYVIVKEQGTHDDYEWEIIGTATEEYIAKDVIVELEAASKKDVEFFRNLRTAFQLVNNSFQVAERDLDRQNPEPPKVTWPSGLGQEQITQLMRDTKAESERLIKVWRDAKFARQTAFMQDVWAPKAKELYEADKRKLPENIVAAPWSYAGYTTEDAYFNIHEKPMFVV